MRVEGPVRVKQALGQAERLLRRDRQVVGDALFPGLAAGERAPEGVAGPGVAGPAGGVTVAGGIGRVTVAGGARGVTIGGGAGGVTVAGGPGRVTVGGGTGRITVAGPTGRAGRLRPGAIPRPAGRGGNASGAPRHRSGSGSASQWHSSAVKRSACSSGRKCPAPSIRRHRYGAST